MLLFFWQYFYQVVGSFFSDFTADTEEIENPEDLRRLFNESPFASVVCIFCSLHFFFLLN